MLYFIVMTACPGTWYMVYIQTKSGYFRNDLPTIRQCPTNTQNRQQVRHYLYKLNKNSGSQYNILTFCYTDRRTRRTRRPHFSIEMKVNAISIYRKPICRGGRSTYTPSIKARYFFQLLLGFTILILKK